MELIIVALPHPSCNVDMYVRAGTYLASEICSLGTGGPSQEEKARCDARSKSTPSMRCPVGEGAHAKSERRARDAEEGGEQRARSVWEVR